MLTELLESRGRRERRSAVGVMSVCAHVALIAGAAVATSRAAPPPAPPPADTLLVYHAPPPRSSSTRAAQPATRSAGPVTQIPDRPPEVAPVGDLTVLPDVDIPLGGIERVSSVEERPGDVPAGPGGTTRSDGVYGPGDAYVEKPALATPGSPQPRYPELLRQAGVSGEVVAEFVVDTLGRVEPGSLHIVRSDHPLFAAAVRAAVPGMRFLPAEAGGRRVRQLVRQPFSFAIR